MQGTYSTPAIRFACFFALSGLCLMFTACGDSDDDGETSSNGATSNGTTSNGATSNGTASNGATSNGTTSNGATSNGTTGGESVDDGVTYNFDSQFVPGANSVSYSGQVARQVLITEMKAYIGGLSDAIDGGTFMPTDDGEVVAGLDFYFRFDSDAYGEESLILATDPAILQEDWNGISTGKDLVGKLAGNDTATDHRDWSTEFAGWSDASIAANGGGIDSPEQLLVAMFETLEENAIGRTNGVVREAPGGEQLPVFVTEDGLDLQQLIQKFLTVALTFHQGADDYLDSDIDGKGLKADPMQDEDAAYSGLEHAWDEGFGYFGAARDYINYEDDELAVQGGRPEYARGYHDTDGDGRIDLKSEYNFALSVNAAKRDRDSVVATDMTTEAFEAFRDGRALIRDAGGPLDAAQMAELEALRDVAVLAWEKALAATVVHYINDVLAEMELFGSEDYDFLGHAKGWSEMKGFALGFQFNPRSPVSAEAFVEFHGLIGDAPVLADAAAEALTGYKGDLLAARRLLQDAYGFDAANMGDDKGEGGW